jgi:hypothetical protein
MNATKNTGERRIYTLEGAGAAPMKALHADSAAAALPPSLPSVAGVAP